MAELILLSRSTDAVKRDTARDLIAEVAESKHLYAGPLRLIEKLSQSIPNPPVPRRLIIGAALGGIGTASLFQLADLYGRVGKILPRFGYFGLNITVVVIGAVLCLSAMRSDPRGARLGLVVCVLAAVAGGLDLTLRALLKLY